MESGSAEGSSHGQAGKYGGGSQYVRKHSEQISLSSCQYSEAQNMRQMRKLSCEPLDFKLKYKTELCKYWKLGSECPYTESCAFAHGYDEMQVKTHLPQNYKTKECKNFITNGFCSYGERCQFKHVQTPCANSLPEKLGSIKKKKSYLEVLQDIDQYYDAEKKTFKMDSPSVKRSRLPTFESITTNDSSSPNSWQGEQYSMTLFEPCYLEI